MKTAGFRLPTAYDYAWSLVDFGLLLVKSIPVRWGPWTNLAGMERAGGMKDASPWFLLVLVLLFVWGLTYRLDSYSEVLGGIPHNVVVVIVWGGVLSVIWTLGAMVLSDLRHRVDVAVTGVGQPRELAADGLEYSPVSLNIVVLADAALAARDGNVQLTDIHVSAASRRLLSGRYARLLDVLPLVAYLKSGGDVAGIVKEVSEALPTGWSDVDVLLGTALLRNAWDRPDGLRAAVYRWRRGRLSSGLKDLITLVEVHLAPDGSRQKRIESWTPERRKQLALLAHDVGDPELARVITRERAKELPYR